LQGSAFAAPRQQSLERRRDQIVDLEELSALVDQPPRLRIGTISPGRKRRQKDQDQNQNQHKFALHNAPSSTSLGGLSMGPYTVLNGSNVKFNINSNATTDTKSRLFSGGQPNIGQSFRRRIRAMRSFESSRHPVTDKHHDQPEPYTRQGYDGIDDVGDLEEHRQQMIQPNSSIFGHQSPWRSQSRNHQRL